MFRGDVDGREFIAFWLADGRVMAGMNVNVWDVTDADPGAHPQSRAVDVGSLRDPEVDLASLASA